MAQLKKMADILKKLYDKIWIKTSLLIGVFLVFYAIREKVTISNNTIIILNITFIAVLLVLLYQRLYEKKFSIIRFFFIFLAISILNRFYDSNVFSNIFKIDLTYAIFYIGIAIFLYIVGSKVLILIKNKLKLVSQLKGKNKDSRIKKWDKIQGEVQTKNKSSAPIPNYYDGNEISKIKPQNVTYTEQYNKHQYNVTHEENSEGNVGNQDKKTNDSASFSEKIVDNIFLIFLYC